MPNQASENTYIASIDGSRLSQAELLDNYGKVTEQYPQNPNGSPMGIAGVCSSDGRVTIMMPHPERVTRAVQNSYRPDDWSEDAPSLRLFRNARRWLG